MIKLSFTGIRYFAKMKRYVYLKSVPTQQLNMTINDVHVYKIQTNTFTNIDWVNRANMNIMI